MPVFYDPLISKLITHGADRAQAIARMRRALDEYRLDGLKTSVPFHRRLVDHPAFLAADLHTGFLQEHPELLEPGTDPWLAEIALVAVAVAHFRRTEQASAKAMETRRSNAGGSAWKRSVGGWRR